MNLDFDVVVIGSGLNGLTAAAYLAKSGARVLVLERASEIGGSCKTKEFAGFRFNSAKMYFVMTELMPAYRDLRLESYGCTYVWPSEQLAVLTSAGDALTLHRDPRASARSIARFSKSDGRRFAAVWKDWTQMQRHGLPALSPGGPARKQAQTGELAANAQTLLSLREESPLQVVRSLGFEDDRLNAAFLAMSCVWGLDPYLRGFGDLVPSCVFRSLACAVIKGGSGNLAKALELAAIAYGADIRIDSEVAQVTVRDGKVSGVSLSNGLRFGGRVILNMVRPSAPTPTSVGEVGLNGHGPNLRPVDVVGGEASWRPVALQLALSERPRYVSGERDADADRALIKLMGCDSTTGILDSYAQRGERDRCSTGFATTPSDFDSTQAPTGAFPGFAVARMQSLFPLPFGDVSSVEGLSSYEDKLAKLWRANAQNLDERIIIRRYAHALPGTNGESHREIDVSVNGRTVDPETAAPGLYQRANVRRGCASIQVRAGYDAAIAAADHLGLRKWWMGSRRVPAER